MGVPASLPAEHADAIVVSRAAFAPPWAEPAHGARDPAVDRPVLGEERADVDRATSRWRSPTSACSTGDETPPAVPFTRRDGSPGRINRHVDVVQTGPPPPPDAPLVVQVSRWDRLKDMAGVMTGSPTTSIRRSAPT